MEKHIFIDSTQSVTPMCILGGECNTDKSPFALDSICCKHRKGYTSVYSLLFSRFTNTKINIAEIGIEAGASLLLWSKYFENADIHAFEIDNMKIQNCKNLNIQNVIYHNIDVSDEKNFNDAFTNSNMLFDIIIDDSSHIIEHQNVIIKHAAKYLQHGGILIVEDIQRDCDISSFAIDENEWFFYTFITCHHNNRYCSDNDKILYLVKK